MSLSSRIFLAGLSLGLFGGFTLSLALEIFP